MNKKEAKIKNIDHLMCGVVAFCIIFGGIINSGSFRVFGIVLTLYRLSIPLLTIIFISKRLQRKEWKMSLLSKNFILYCGMMIFWIFYGGLLLFVSPYAPLHDGLKELIDLSMGLLSIYCIVECCSTIENVHYFMKILKVIALILICFSIFEVFTGIHFPTSEYGNYQSFKNLGSVFLVGISTKQLFPITTIFYGINDYSVLIAVLFPLFYVEKGQTARRKSANIIMMFLIILILTFNDANICLIGIVVATAFRIIFKHYRKNSILTLGGIVFTQQLTTSLVAKVVLAIKGGLHHLHLVDMQSQSIKDTMLHMGKDAINKTSNLSEVVSSQVHNANAGAGSLWYRMMLALDSLEMWVKSHLLGVGPSGFTSYLKKNGSRTYLTNPHNWWLEILSQYGILVFLAYLASMVYIFYKNLKDYLFRRDEKQLQFLCMCVIFAIGCIAPSSFLGYSYQWILPALGIAFISIKQ